MEKFFLNNPKKRDANMLDVISLHSEKEEEEKYFFFYE